MKTVIKYELTINKAMRSALSYGTPDEQINEFIRYLGKHIGADRIYIFEDCPKKNITKNTYEWCAEGVNPEIDNLQSVPMELIGWWYDLFDQEKNVIIEDMEDIKETHPDSYELLSGQNIHRLVVAPFRYENEISGFFGVDNPPDTDSIGLTLFLDMMSTLIISMIKIRDTHNKTNRMARFMGYAAFAQIYIFIHYINVQTHRYEVIKNADDGFEDTIDGSFEIHIKKLLKKCCANEYVSKELAFADIDTVEERLDGRASIVSEFYGTAFGWCRGRFIPVDYDNDGRLLHVIYCIESIDEQKERENSLLSMAQTDLMTGIYNRGHGESLIEQSLHNKVKGMMCIIDCDKFKSINDTYGHSVGDDVIIAIAHTLQNVCRKNDIIMRLGGDEFAMYFPGVTDKKNANEIFERIFKRTEKLNIKALGNRRITLSLGACFYDGIADISYDSLYCNADEAMYKSKKNKGFCATIYEP